MPQVVLPQLVLYVLYRMHSHGYECFVVGGAVRDVLLKRETKDWDFTTNATPEEIQAVFPEHFYDNQFGTVSVPVHHVWRMMQGSEWQVDSELKQDWEGQVLELTTYRTEMGYSDNRRPDEVAWGNNLQEDLQRRDFTINALALSIGKPVTSETRQELPLSGYEAFARSAGELSVDVEMVDEFGGQADLEQRVIRAVGNALERFSEDALRMMRAIRFGAQLGFVIEPATLEAIGKQASLLNQISWERKRDELMKIIASDHPADGIKLLVSSGLANDVLPELLPMIGVKQGGHHIYDVYTHSIESLRECPSTDPIVRLATLLHDVGKPKTVRYQGPRGVTFYGHEVVGARMVKEIGKRLRLSAKELERLFILVRWHMFVYDPEMTDAAIRRFIRRVGIENINDMLLLRVGDRKGGGSNATSWRLREFQERIGSQLYEPMQVKDLVISGHDVIKELQIQPGPIIGKLLNILFEEVLEDTSLNTREYLVERMRELYEKMG